MEPLSQKEPVEPAVQHVPVADTVQLFQKDVPMFSTNAKQGRFAYSGRKKLLIIGLVLGILIVITGIAYAFAVISDGMKSQDLAVTDSPSDDITKGAQNDFLVQDTSQLEVSTTSDTSSAPSTTAQPSSASTSSGVGSSTTQPIGSGDTIPAPSSGGTTATTPKTYDISYTSSCYSPANIIIKKNDTVRFTNNNTKKMWPASDNHPSHAVYPEFDANDDIAPGGTYFFTLTKIGSWDYHDHIKPSCTGTITVL